MNIFGQSVLKLYFEQFSLSTVCKVAFYMLVSKLGFSAVWEVTLRMYVDKTVYPVAVHRELKLSGLYLFGSRSISSFSVAPKNLAVYKKYKMHNNVSLLPSRVRT